MPPKVDPTEVRFSIILSMQSTLKYSEVSQDQQPHLPLSSALSVWYNIHHVECQEGWLGHRQGGRQMEGN